MLKNDGTPETTDGCGANSLMTVNVVIPSTPTPTPTPSPLSQVWWHVKNGDVATNENLISIIGDPAQKFENPGSGGYPGIPSYGLASSTNLTGVNVSEAGRLP